MASGPDQPPAGPPRLAGTLARHRWAAAAGMTATIAVVAGGGLVLALHDSAAAPPKECGLVPCAAALPASVQSRGNESASASATAAQRASTPPGPAHSPTSPAPSATAPGASAPEASAPEATAPAAATPRATPSVAAPAAAAPQAAAPPDQPVSAGRVFMPDPRFSCTTVIAFLAGDTLSPVRCRFTDSASHQHSRDRSSHLGSGAARENTSRAGGQPGSGPGGHGDWQGSWLRGLSGGWPGTGWSGTGWSGTGWPGAGWSAGGWSGRHGGWPRGR